MMKYTFNRETVWVEKYSLSLCQQWAPSYPFLLSNCPNWKIISRSFPEEKKRELKLLQIIFHSSILDNFPPSSEFQICQFWFHIFSGFVFRKCGFRLLKGAAGASFTPRTCLLGPVWWHFKPGHQHSAPFSKWIFILCPEIMFDFFPMRESKLLWWCSYS